MTSPRTVHRPHAHAHGRAWRPTRHGAAQTGWRPPRRRCVCAKPSQPSNAEIIRWFGGDLLAAPGHRLAATLRQRRAGAWRTAPVSCGEYSVIPVMVSDADRRVRRLHRAQQPCACCRVPAISAAASPAAWAATMAATNPGLVGRRQLPRSDDRLGERSCGGSSGNTLLGLSSQPGSNADLMRRCWSSSVLRELHAHQVALLDADAVLAGQAAADLDAQGQDVGAEPSRRAWKLSGSLASNMISGCRLPSPAWKMFAT